MWLHIRYESKRKEESFFIIGYLLELIIKIWRFGKKKSSKSGEFLSFFSMKNPLFRLESYYSVKETLPRDPAIIQFGGGAGWGRCVWRWEYIGIWNS
jgi:hypothetical protein